MNQSPLPAWLTKTEHYTPEKDKDAFIDRSILSFLGVLSRIRMQSAHRASAFPAHAFFKLAFTLALAVLVSLSQSQAFVLTVAVGVLCRVAALPARDVARVLRAGLVAVLFSALVLLPAGFMGNWYSIAMITPKIFSTVCALSLLSINTKWHELTAAFKYLYIPDIFIFVLDTAIKYILLLGEFALHMLWALRLRSVGRQARRGGALSGIAGTMFLRSREMAAEMHAAMECRGFTGEYRRPARFGFGWADAALLALLAALITLFMILR